MTPRGLGGVAQGQTGPSPCPRIQASECPAGTPTTIPSSPLLGPCSFPWAPILVRFVSQSCSGVPRHERAITHPVIALPNSPPDFGPSIWGI